MPGNHAYGLLVAAGSDHDLNKIYCSDVVTMYNLTICKLTENKFTKKVLKIHIHPKFEFPNPKKNLSSTFSVEEFSFLSRSFDIALLEVESFDLSDELNILPGCLFESNAHSFEGKLLAAGLF